MKQKMAAGGVGELMQGHASGAEVKWEQKGQPLDVKQ